MNGLMYLTQLYDVTSSCVRSVRPRPRKPEQDADRDRRCEGNFLCVGRCSRAVMERGGWPLTGDSMLHVGNDHAVIVVSRTLSIYVKVHCDLLT